MNRRTLELQQRPRQWAPYLPRSNQWNAGNTAEGREADDRCKMRLSSGEGRREIAQKFVTQVAPDVTLVIRTNKTWCIAHQKTESIGNLVSAVDISKRRKRLIIGVLCNQPKGCSATIRSRQYHENSAVHHNINLF